MNISSLGKNLKDANEKNLSMIKNIVIPKMYYRNDIGIKFFKEDRRKLKEWGYL